MRTSRTCRPICSRPCVRVARLSARASQADISASSENNTPDGKSSVVYTIDNASSELYTRISVNGENRPGLLSAITGVFANMGIDVRKAEVSTQGGKVNDTFYIVNPDGNKIEESELLGSIEAALNAIVEGQGSRKKQRRPAFAERGTEHSSIKTELMSAVPYTNASVSHAPCLSLPKLLQMPFSPAPFVHPGIAVE